MRGSICISSQLGIGVCSESFHFGKSAYNQSIVVPGVLGLKSQLINQFEELAEDSLTKFHCCQFKG